VSTPHPSSDVPADFGRDGFALLPGPLSGDECELARAAARSAAGPGDVAASSWPSHPHWCELPDGIRAHLVSHSALPGADEQPSGHLSRTWSPGSPGSVATGPW